MMTVIILSAILLVAGFVIINLLLKIESIDDELAEINLFMVDILTDLKAAQQQMSNIDSTGAFNSDDETGTVFRELNNIVNTLAEKYEIDEEVTDSE